MLVHLHMMILAVGWSTCWAAASEKPVGHSPAAPRRPWCLSQTTCTDPVPSEPAFGYMGSAASSAGPATDSASPWPSLRAYAQTLSALSPLDCPSLKHIKLPMWPPSHHSMASSWTGLLQYVACRTLVPGRPADSSPLSFDLSSRCSSFRRYLIIGLWS